MPDNLCFRFIDTNGIRLHVAEAGPADGPLVILLHGFPEFWYGWRKQIPALAAAGYRVWAPDQRGYNLSDKPSGVSSYRISSLAADVIGLIDAAGCQRASIIGHDWGGMVAWWLAQNRPQRLHKAAILNVPHGAVMRRWLLTSPRQMLRSWYVFMLQIPWLPERGIARNDYRGMVEGLHKSSRPGTFTDADMERYRECWRQPGGMTGMINWYRAALRYPGQWSTMPRISLPTLLLWGANDKFAVRDLAPASIALCDSGRLEFFEDATHWLPHEEPEPVNERLVAFLRES